MKKLFAILIFTVLIGEAFAQNLTTRKVGANEDPKEASERNLRLTVGGGYAYRLGRIEKSGDSKVDDFMSSLRNGYNLDLDAQYYFKESWGLGINAVYTQQSKQASNELNIPNLGTVTNYKETNTFVYVGPSVIMRFEKDKLGAYMSAGFGPLFYNTTSDATQIMGELTKTTVGSYLGIAGEYRFSQNIGAGVKLSVTAGNVNIQGVKQNVSNFMATTFISFRTK